MIRPSLSRLERERIAKAAQSPEPIRWKAFGLRLWYEHRGASVTVFTAGTWRVFQELAEEAATLFREERAKWIEMGKTNGNKSSDTGEGARDSERGCAARITRGRTNDNKSSNSAA